MFGEKREFGKRVTVEGQRLQKESKLTGIRLLAFLH